jgi:hypothetical protein
MTREICKICFHPVSVGFHVPNAIWQQVLPHILQYRSVCLGCFTRLADEAMVRWDEAIEFFPVSLVSMLDDEEVA